MGLKQTKTLDSGITVENAYIRVSSFYGNKSNIEFIISTYFSREYYLDGMMPVVPPQRYSFVPDMSRTAKNPLEQIYMYVKTIDEFSDAFDVFEEGQI